ncbi:putative SPX domain-containing protein 1 isoform X1 [Iris pallida]|uniref:SPX domain-containing protein 1 isoform X1 n=1 Tax=Iris pallida TaxID=29817 RepID=A0AAX6GM33_IRIPA|nr:putative SPX domain-containing protein 1 isoform X1 [Iris pallida]
MKFGKSLSNQIEEALPEWRDKFISYKGLKKRLKLIGGGGDRPPAKKAKLSASDGAAAMSTTTEEEEDFLKLLEAELVKFNNFFEEKEEEYIIRQKELHDQVQRVVGNGSNSREELMKVRREIVDLHGEMVLLENYSALNYTGLVKILKKYDKRTGALIRLPFIQKVLQQPFFTTDLLYRLVKKCEAMLDHLFPKAEPSISGDNGEGIDGDKPPGSSLARGDVADLEEIEFMESVYMKSTVAALRVLKEIRSGSSTVSVFSLPPLQANGAEERIWKKAPAVLEQLAK